MKRSITGLALLLWVLALGSSAVQADMHGSFSDRIQAAMDADSRPEKDRARDANRLPKETLSFFGIDSGQRVLEVLPGGGWYTRLLASALDGNGQLYLGMGGRVSDELKKERFMASALFLENEAALEATERKGIYSIGAFDFGVKDVDAVLTFRNWHNLTPEARAHANRAAFKALRPGGVFGVIDHTRRHNEPDNDENRRRLDPVLVIAEIQAAGFDFEASSDLHARPADGLDKEVGHESVTGQTDRFTLKFRKPAN